MKNSKKCIAAIASIFLVLSTISTYAQSLEPNKIDSVTNEELQNFAAAAESVQIIQNEANNEVRQLVQQKNLDYRRFQAIMMSKSTPEMSDTLTVTDEEKAILEKMQPQLARINQQSKREFDTAIQENNLTRQRFQQIMLLVRTEPNVADRFQKIIADRTEE